MEKNNIKKIECWLRVSRYINDLHQSLHDEGIYTTTDEEYVKILDFIHDAIEEQLKFDPLSIEADKYISIQSIIKILSKTLRTLALNVELKIKDMELWETLSTIIQQIFDLIDELKNELK